MGQCILRIHNREDKKKDCGYRPYGMYGNYNSSDSFASPIEKEKELSVFENLFRLERKKNSGLSVIIPFYAEEITIDHLAYSVIEQYFYPILEGKLEVEIGEEDNKIILDRNSIEQSLNKLNFSKLADETERKIRTKESLLHLFEFAKWAIRLKEADFFKLNKPETDYKPRWSKSLFENEKELNALRDKFDRNERVAFKVPLKYYPVDGKAKLCWYDAFLEKDTSLVKAENHFVRDGITITGINSVEKGLVRGIVVIHDTDLARMLGDSENPAHTEWQPESRNFKDKYVHGKEALTFIKNTLKALHEKLQRPIDGIQKDLLLDFFSIPVETIEEDTKQKQSRKKSSGNDDTEEPDIPTVIAKKRPILIEQISSGLKIYKNPDAKNVPESLRLKLGYDVPRGNPIKSYQDLDFDVSKSPIKIVQKGVTFTKKEKNELEFEIDKQNDFEILLTGFDENRDLFLKIM